MWTCQRCNQEFEKENQKHKCNDSITPIDDYISTQPIEIQPLLHQVRNAISKVLPNAQEKISWGMPTYWRKHNIIHFAAFKKHLGIYPGSEAIEHFKDKLNDLKHTKGAIQIPYDKPLPLALISEIAKWCEETGNHH